MSVGIFGYGEVGKGIASFYTEPIQIKDLSPEHKGFEGDIGYIHVCTPYSENFIDEVRELIINHTPRIVFIHSTVPVGTTESIGGGDICAYSPIRGVHPNLGKGMNIFTTYVGSDHPALSYFAVKYLESIDMGEIKLAGTTRTVEAMKLWDTTQYGWMIILNKAIKKWCEENNVDFNLVYTDANKSYNKGYNELGMDYVNRPYLKYTEGPIGGHCVMPNLELLDSDICDIIKQFSKDL